jgi:uncharacterized membrane protein
MAIAYLLFKALHIIGVVVFLGNITVGIFWKSIADRSKSPAIIAHTLAGIIGADRVFTFPGIGAILVGGIGAALIGHLPFLSTGWLVWGIGLFILSGIAFGPASGAQRTMLTIAQAGVATGKFDWERYHMAEGVWNIWGTVALILPLVALVIMVLKPALPAF